jgi:seryl-tRNA synthetase
VLAALLENNLQPDGSVLIPQALRRWFGKDRLVLA